MVPDLRLVPVYLGGRAARRAGTQETGGSDGLLDAGIETLHALVVAKLGADPALSQLERDAAAGVDSERTRRRVHDAVEQAAEDDDAFAGRLYRLLDDLAKVADPPPAPAEPEARFDPFNFIPAFPLKVRNVNSGWLILPGAVVGLVLVTATAVEGTLGSADDFHFVRDVQYVFSGSVQHTKPSFPLVRDVTSVFLFLVITAGVILLHKQWQYIAAALPALRRANVVTPRRQPRSNVISRLIRLDRLLGDCPDYQALDRLDQRMGSVGTRTKVILSGAVLFTGFIMATLVGNGLRSREEISSVAYGVSRGRIV